MKLGTYYYPEQWPDSQWERDFDGIKSLGLQIVHMGEFAWFSLEPRPGDFQLDWLDKCLTLADERDLHVILCTPTAAPPVWLVEQHPEILPVNATGRAMRFGGRRHYSPLAPAFHEATGRIVAALAERFGDHPAVIGWQIDNEYAGDFDQSPTAHAAFREGLKQKYGTIDKLNEAWGCQFWNSYYTDFSQILLPPSRVPGYLHGTIGNPHQCLDASRFWSHAYAAFNKLQADILRPHVGDRFLTTNFMPFHLDCDPKEMAGDLSLISWDAYPVAAREQNPSSEHYRLGDPAFLGFVHSQMASYNGRWAQMELQPGQINWSGYPARLFPGAVRLWLWTAFAHGAEFVTTYRYRQPRFGIELFHEGLVGPDGVTPSAGGREFAQVAEEISRLDLTKLASMQDDFDPATTVGLLFDFEQLWYFQTLPQAQRWNQPAWLQSWYAGCARQGLRVKIVHPDSPWPAGLKMLIVPAMQMVDDALIRRLQDYANAGGHLVLTCRTGWMDRRGQLWEGPTAGPILPLIGATIEGYDSLPAGKFADVEMEGKKFKWGIWGEQLHTGPGTKILATYADEFYAGAPAVTQSNFGEGVVTYCGVCAEWPFIEALVAKLAPTAGLTTTSLPWRVHLIQRGPYRVLLNYNDAPVNAPANKKAKFIVGGRKVIAGGVAAWVE
jgi:beta-galactosidase